MRQRDLHGVPRAAPRCQVAEASPSCATGLYRSSSVSAPIVTVPVQVKAPSTGSVRLLATTGRVPAASPPQLLVEHTPATTVASAPATPRQPQHQQPATQIQVESSTSLVIPAGSSSANGIADAAGGSAAIAATPGSRPALAGAEVARAVPRGRSSDAKRIVSSPAKQPLGQSVATAASAPMPLAAVSPSAVPQPCLVAFEVDDAGASKTSTAAPTAPLPSLEPSLRLEAGDDSAGSTPLAAATGGAAAGLRGPSPAAVSDAGSMAEDHESSKFWKPAVSRLYKLYVRPRLGTICEALAQLDAIRWLQLLAFVQGLHGFLRDPCNSTEPPPPVPLPLLTHLLRVYVSGEVCPFKGSAETSAPLWYLEALQILRLQLRPSTSSSSSSSSSDLLANGGQTPGKRSSRPPRSVQFFVHLLSAVPVANFLVAAAGLALRCQGLDDGTDGSDDSTDARLFRGISGAWGRHGGDFVLACQHVLIRLYPISASPGLRGPRAALTEEEVPSLVAVLVAAACHFGSQMVPLARMDNGSGASDEEAPAKPPGEQFSSILQLISGVRNSSSLGSTDRFLASLRDVLNSLLGPGPSSPDHLPEPVPLAEPPSEAAATHPHIKVLVRIVRTIIQAYYTNPTLLAAREAGREQTSLDGLCRSSSGPFRTADEVLAAGSFAGPSEPGDFVAVPDHSGPLRRSLSFMEQSALLQAVQSKLCTTKFDDITGATEQLETYGLRNLRVLWFDLRMCTSTLKQDLQAISGAPSKNRGVVHTLLVLRNMRLCLVHDWEAKLATFPYLHLRGSSQVTVRSLGISVSCSLNYTDGIVFRAVDVGLPDLEVQLGCTSSFSLVVLSALLKIFQASLQDQLQKQMQRMMLQALQHESGKWNKSIWKTLQTVVPERLVSKGLSWVSANIPKEGLPI